MNTFIGMILFLWFLGMILYIIKGGNLVVGFLFSAVVWAILGGVPLRDIPTKIIQDGAVGYGGTIITVIFGSWFGRVLVETGIVGSIIRKTIELGGDRPRITASLLAIVTSLIFTSVYGVGTAIAIGVISIPMMLSLGIPKKVAVSSFLLSYGAGMYVNQVSFKVYEPYFNGAVTFTGSFFKFGIIALAVQLSVTLVMLAVRLRKGKLQHAWAVQVPAERTESRHIPAVAYFTPLLPVILAVALKWEPIPSLLLSILFALLVTGKFKSYRDGLALTFKTLRDGCAEVSMLIIIMLSIVMFSKSAGICAPLIGNLIQPILPRNPLILALAFGVLAPLGGLFRGPFVLLGMGTATLAILQNMNLFPPIFVLLSLYIPDMAMCFSGCPTHSSGAWAISYAKITPGEHIKSTAPWGWIACFLNLLIMALIFG